MNNIKNMKYVLLSSILIYLDYIIKIKVKTNMSVGDKISVIKKFFSITYVQNTGAAFGILQNKKFLFLIVGIVAVGFMIYMFYKSNDILSKISITMIISGALGNMIDRVKYGFVVDMFDFHAIWQYVFNFADACVVCGVALLSLSILMQKDS